MLPGKATAHLHRQEHDLVDAYRAVAADHAAELVFS